MQRGSTFEGNGKRDSAVPHDCRLPTASKASPSHRAQSVVASCPEVYQPLAQMTVVVPIVLELVMFKLSGGVHDEHGISMEQSSAQPDCRAVPRHMRHTM